MSAPLLLLHGVTNSASIWGQVVPLLEGRFDLLVPTARGHRGGPPMSGRVTISSLVDDAEAMLDRHGLSQVHIAGNSMGGWMALELARRGRALSVCALSPAGCWTPGAHDETHATSTIRRGRRLATASRTLAPLAMRSGLVRRHLLRDAAEHGDRVTARAALELLDDLIGCAAAPDLLGTTESLAGFQSTPCPTLLAWSQHDRVFPVAVNGRRAQDLVPGARWTVLPDVGHVPMLDDPVLVARTISDFASPAGLQDD